VARSQLDIILRLNDKASAGLKRAGKSLSGFQKTAALAGGALLAAAGAAAAFGIHAVKTAARVETLGVVTKTLGKNVGLTETQIRNFEESIVAQGITMQAARQSIAQMIQANIDLGKSADIARLAQNAAVIAGVDSSEAFNRVVTTIQTANVRMGRTIGLQLNFNDAYKKGAEELGKTADQLTEVEKAAIRTNHVLEQGANIANAYEESMETAGKQITSLKRHWEALTVAIGERGLPVWTEAVFGASKLLEGLTGLVEVSNKLRDAEELLTEAGMNDRDVRALIADDVVRDIGLSDAMRHKKLELAGAIDVERQRWVAMGQAAELASQKAVEGAEAQITVNQGIVSSFTDITEAQIATEALDVLNDALETGQISPEEYELAFRELADSLDISAAQQDAHLKFAAIKADIDAGTSSVWAYVAALDTLQRKLRQGVLGGSASIPEDERPGVQQQHGGSFTVPPGFPNDSYRMGVSSGERVNVSNDSRSFFQGGNVNINNGTQLEAFEEMLKQIQ
jgi:hypothetical protein